MPRKKIALKSHASTSSVRIRENSRLMETHESMVDYLSGRTSVSSFMNVFAPNFLGLNFLKPLEDDLIYSDEDDDYDDDDEDDDDDDDCFPGGATDGPLEPHPQIRQLTDEEADQFGKELLQEEERRKDKTEKNKRKKMRKKEKKRLEKEKAAPDNLPEEERAKCDSSENQNKSTSIESNPKTNEPCQGDKSQRAIEAAGGGEDKSNAEKRKETTKKDSDLENSRASSAKSAPEESRNPKPTTGQKKETSVKVEQREEVKPDAEKPAILKKKEEEETQTSKEKKVDSTEALAKKSREFANMGNRLAASGQYQMAVKYFTDAIKCNPKEFKLFGNRSLCYERVQQYENALQDADVALSMEPSWIKGLFRKGKALSGLKRYYEASLTYQQVLKLDSTSPEAAQELKRAQTLHLMELGFSWAQSSEALKTYATLEEVVEALFAANRHTALCAANAGATGEPPALQEEDEGEGGWTVLQAGRSRTHQIRESGESRSHSLSPTPRSRILPKPDLFPVWVGTLSPAMTYVRLHELFSRTGTVYSIKMLLEQQCAFVNYTRQEDCDRAIEYIHGMLVDGAPLTVRYPFKAHAELGASKSAATDPFTRPGTYKKECFFWRTTGCTRQDCTFRHVPENKNIDRERFTSRLGSMGNQK